jgi:hypothetical protein
MNDDEVAVLRTEVARLTRVLERALELSAGGSAFAFPPPLNLPQRTDLLRKPTTMLGGRALLHAAHADNEEMSLREKFLSRDFRDGTAWNLLVHLLIARIEERSVSVTDAMSASRAPPTTALRYLTLLVEEEMCTRDLDPGDSRRTWIALSDKAYRKMSMYYEARRNARWRRGGPG